MKSLRSIAARLGAAPAATLLVIAATACAADPGSGRSGGLVPSPRKTREELVREWDLNSDGTIDQGEAEVAASRMRRERAELRLNSGIDPITGLPRGEEGAEATDENPERAADEAEAAEAMPEEEPETVDAGRDEDERPVLPGTRVPKPRLPGLARPAGKKADLNAALKPSVNGAADRSRRPLTGGTRAGGLPAQAGYGSGVPTRPLNAGQPVAPKVRVIVPQAPRGGLTPSSRPAATVVRPTAPPPPPAGPREAYNPY